MQIHSPFTLQMDKSYFKYGVRSPKFIWAPCAQLYSLAETPQSPHPPPRIWAHIRGPRLTTSLCDPGINAHRLSLEKQI
jgi:hypothetical protein